MILKVLDDQAKNLNEKSVCAKFFLEFIFPKEEICTN